jgi:hypothetical protein
MGKKTENKDGPLFNLINSDEPPFCSRMSPMTSEELEILDEMRDLKDQAREIKERLAGILPDWKQWIHKPLKATLSLEAKNHLQRLNELRTKWKEHEEAYEEARHRRMVALGHEDL